MTPYRCIIADPPWAYSDTMRKMQSTGDGCAAKYRTMSIDEIIAMAGTSNAGAYLCNEFHEFADDAHLWLWVTNAFMEQGHCVAEQWGFEPKTIATWVKGRLGIREDCGPQGNDPPKYEGTLIQHIGQGHYLRNSTEHVIFAVRGRCPALVNHLPTAFVYPGRWPGRLHSEKPPTIHEWAEKLSPGPRLELFARKRRDGWDVVGDEIC